MALRDILDTFSSETTVHGLPKVIKSRSRTGRVFWVAACVLAIAVCSAQFVQLLTKYYSYPKKVTIEVVTEHVPFPSISLCNMRNLDTAILNEMNRIFNGVDINAVRLTWNGNETGEFVDEYMRMLSKYYPMFRDETIETILFQQALSRTTIATNIDRPLVISAGIPRKEFVVSCMYGGNLCNLSGGYFEDFFDPYYYNCYTYHAPEHQDDDSMLAEGLENGWSSVVLTGSGMLDTNKEVRMIPGTHELHSPQASNEGVRIVIHPPHSVPFPHTEGFDVPPGHSVSFGLRPHVTERIGPPHGNCTGHRDGYRLIECQKNCVQKGIVERCGCKNINLPEEWIPAGVRFCSKDYNIPMSCADNATEDCYKELVKFSERMQCARDQSNILSRNATLARECGCFPPCHELGYDVTYSLSKWPAQSFDGEEAYIDIFENIKYLERFNNSRDRVKFELYQQYFNPYNRSTSMQDFARLNVYIADSNVIKTIENEDYQTSQLLSDIGGQLGLWIGVSVISLSELLELAMDLLAYTARRHILRRRESRKNRDYERAQQNGRAYRCGEAEAGEVARHRPQYYQPYRYTDPHPGSTRLLLTTSSSPRPDNTRQHHTPHNDNA